MVLYDWGYTFSQSLTSLWWGIVEFVPVILAAVIIFIAGWIVGAVLGKLVSQTIKSLKVDEALRKAGVGKIFDDAHIKLDVGGVLGMLVKWFFIVAFLIGSLDVLGLTEVNVFLRTVVLKFIPMVVIAVLILLVAAVVGDATQKLVAGSAHAAKMKTANILGALAKWIIWILGILVALSQFSIASYFIETFFTGIVVAFAIAFGLAFGLGGQQAASRAIERVQSEIAG